MKLIFVSNDLFFASRVKGACQLKGLEFVFSAKLPPTSASLQENPQHKDPERGDHERGSDDDIQVIAVDLSALRENPAEIVAAARKNFPSAKLIAYAPHVHKNDLEDASQAKFDVVMTRGQFNQWLQTSAI